MPCLKLTTPACVQVCAARVQSLFQVSLLGSYVSSMQALGQWSLSPYDTQQLATAVLPKVHRRVVWGEGFVWYLGAGLMSTARLIAACYFDKAFHA